MIPRWGGELRTGQVAALAGVTPITIVRWADAGRVECSRMLGRGDRRFTPAAVRALLAQLGRPVPDWLAE